MSSGLPKQKLGAWITPTPYASANSLSVTAAGSSAARQLDERFAEVVDVKDHGCVGDGVSDDSANFQAAVDYAYANRKRVYAPSGSYLFGTSIDLTGKQGLDIVGDGSGFLKPTKFLAKCPGRALFDCVGARDIHFQDFAVAGDGTNTPAAAFLFSRAAGMASAGTNHLTSIQVNGYFTKAAIVSMSSEVNVYERCNITNSYAGGHGYWTSQDNDSGIASNYLAVPATQGGGNTMHIFLASAFIVDGGSTSSAMKLGTVSGLTAIGHYTNSNGFAAIEITDDLEAFSFQSWRDESSSSYALYLAANKNLTDGSFAGGHIGPSFYGANGSTFERVSFLGAGQHFDPAGPAGVYGINAYDLYYCLVQPAGQNIQVRHESGGNIIVGAQDGVSGGAIVDLGTEVEGNFLTRDTSQPVDSYGVVSDLDTTTISATDEVMTSMTVTPGAGDYLVTFSGHGHAPTGGADTVYWSIYKNGSQVAGSERSQSGAQEYGSWQSTVKVTGVTAGQAVDVRWRVTGGTSRVKNRSLTLVRLA